MAIVEVTTIMVFMAPKVYYGIKDKGRAEGREEGVDDTIAAMREAGVYEEPRRRVEDTIFRRARRSRNGKQPQTRGRGYSRARGNRPRNGERKIRREILMRLENHSAPTQELPPMTGIRFIPA